MHRG